MANSAGTYPWPQVELPVAVVPWTSKTGGLELVGLPYGQDRDAASVAASTVNGASPLYTKEDTCLLVLMGEARENAKKVTAAKIDLNMAVSRRGGKDANKRLQSVDRI